MTSAPAFSVASLAARWECSPSAIRNEIARGHLRIFRIGTLIRIPAEEVDRFESNLSPSSASAPASPSSGETAPASATATPLRHPIGSAPTPKPASAGGSAIVVDGPWAESSKRI